MKTWKTWTDVVSVEQAEAAQALLDCDMVKQHIKGTVVQLTEMVLENGTFVLPDKKRTCMQVRDGVVTLVERKEGGLVR